MANLCPAFLVLIGLLAHTHAGMPPSSMKMLRSGSISPWAQEIMIGTANCDVTTYGAKGDGSVRFVLPLLLPPLPLPTPPLPPPFLLQLTVCLVTSGKSDDTSAIQKAIDDCGSKGGGTVTLPSGKTFSSFALDMSHNNLQLVIDGTLLVNNDRGSWPKGKDIITATGVSNIGITGSGTVEGQGEVWWEHRDDFRPLTVKFEGVTTALIHGITFNNPPNHCLELFANHMEVSNVQVKAPPSTDTDKPSHNTDGIDVHGSPFYVHDTHIDTGDDNFAIHSSEVLIENCKLGHGHGASVGSPCNGQTQSNITLRNIDFDGTDSGAKIKAQQCPGTLSGVTFESLTMKNVGKPIDVTVWYHSDRDTQTITNSSAANDGSLVIENIAFKDIKSEKSQYGFGLACSDNEPCKGISMQNVDLGDNDSCELSEDGGDHKDASGCDCFEYVTGSASGSGLADSCISSTPQPGRRRKDDRRRRRKDDRRRKGQAATA